MRSISKRMLDIVSAVSIFVLWFLVFLQVLSRYIFEKPISYSLELIQLVFIISIFIGSAAVHLDDTERHLGFDFITTKLSGVPLLVSNLVGEIVVAAFLVIGLISGVFATINGVQSTLPLSGIAVSWKYIWLPVSFCIMLFGSIWNIYQMVKHAKSLCGKQRGE